jgi:hypothetical protein
MKYLSLIISLLVAMVSCSNKPTIRNTSDKTYLSNSFYSAQYARPIIYSVCNYYKQNKYFASNYDYKSFIQKSLNDNTNNYKEISITYRTKNCISILYSLNEFKSGENTYHNSKFEIFILINDYDVLVHHLNTNYIYIVVDNNSSRYIPDYNNKNYCTNVYFEE